MGIIHRMRRNEARVRDEHRRIGGLLTARWSKPRTAVQPDSTSNATTLRASRLNSTATRWIGSPVPRYLSA